MKTNGWLILGVMLSTSVFAQQVTTPPPAATPAPEAVAKPAKKKAATEKKIAFVEKTVSLMPGPATIVGNNVNVRGQATLNSEVLTRLNDGDAVTVLEQINLEKHKADEPAQWAKIVLPEGGHVWVHASFIDPTNLTVVPSRLNMRGGPGENYSVLGVLEHGETVREVLTENNWMRIGVPPSAYGFVAAIYLKQEVPAVAVTTPPPTPAEVAPAPAPSAPAPAPVVVPAPAPTELAPLPTPVTNIVETPPVTPQPAEAPAATPVVAQQPVVTPAPEPAPAAPPVEEPLPKRIVQHEGVVKGTWSIQAPTKFALVDPDTGKTINYLYTTSTNLDLRRYKGLRIVVTGEEGLDERWKNTPVITIQRIQVVE